MKSILILLGIFSTSLAFSQGSMVVVLDGKEWKAKTVSAGIGKIMDMTTFTITGRIDKERFDVSVDYNALKGKDSATVTFSQNLMAPPGGASLSYVPKGLGKQQWCSASGTLLLSEFDEKANTASGTFEGSISQLLDDKGAFILKSPRPTKSVSGSFEKVHFQSAQ